MAHRIALWDGQDLPACQPDRKLRGPEREPATCLRNDDLQPLRRLEIHVVRVVSGLRDYSHIRKLFEQRARESCSLAIGDQRIEAPQRRGTVNRGREDANLCALAKPAHALGALVRLVNVIENRNAHVAQRARLDVAVRPGTMGSTTWDGRAAAW